MNATIENFVRRLAISTAVTTLAAFPCLAHADEVADRGLAMNGWAAIGADRSVNHVSGGEPLHEGMVLGGLTTMVNIRHVEIGASVDGMPAIFGDGRLSLGGLAGWQASRGPAVRLHVLAEGGLHVFTDVGGGIFSHQEGASTWLPYLGLRIGATRTIPAGRHFDVGVWLFARNDIGTERVTTVDSGFFGPSTSTQYDVGGLTAGLALHIGLRFEKRHPEAANSATP